ncbi:hypothetical protein OIU78_009043 [Salix suchowensis]|nr:hypothetical protein OIU78_009043 [Salix suchowensis]
MDQNLEEVQSKLTTSQKWDYISNTHSCNPPICRIMIGWNPSKFSLTVIHSSSQWLICQASSTATNTSITITFIYGQNTPAERRNLWDYIKDNSASFSTLPWLLMGDFNALLSPEYRDGGDSNWYGHSEDFANSVHQAGLIHIPFKGPRLTWHNGQHGTNTIQKKLDWSFCNPSLLHKWPSAYTQFLPRNISDHSGMHTILTISPLPKKPFHFLHLWLQRDDFNTVLHEIWSKPIYGNPIFILHSKLQAFKARMKTYHKQNTSHISQRLNQATTKWNSLQHQLDHDISPAQFRNPASIFQNKISEARRQELA